MRSSRIGFGMSASTYLLAPGGGRHRFNVPPRASLAEISTMLGGPEKAFIDRQNSKAKFRRVVDKKLTEQYNLQKPSFRHQQKVLAELGPQEGLRELVSPTKESKNAQLARRPLDRKILEEIYSDIHGMRTERMLKRGVQWEKWLAQGEDTPVKRASDEAKRSFGMGGHITMLATAKSPEMFAPIDRRQKEFVFIGATNVGKSSLINALLNSFVCRWGTSPGTTQSVNTYEIGNRFRIVDTPGLGFYASAYASTQKATGLRGLTLQYLASGDKRVGHVANSSAQHHQQGGPASTSRLSYAERREKRRPIARVMVCITPRGLREEERLVCKHIDNLGIPFSVLVCKTDQVRSRQLAQIVDKTRSELLGYKHCHELMMVSALRLSGVSKLQSMVANLSGGDDKQQREAKDIDFSVLV